MAVILRSESSDFKIKVLVVGESGVGKTCLLLRYTDNMYSPRFITTIGVDYRMKNVVVNDHVVKLQIWDTAGQERFRHITTSYFRDAEVCTHTFFCLCIVNFIKAVYFGMSQAIMLVYDATDRDTFESIPSWMMQIQAMNPYVQVVLIGNKSDRVEKIQVPEAEGRALADHYGVPFFSTTAKDNQNVQEAFTMIAEKCACLAKARTLNQQKLQFGVDPGSSCAC